MRILSLQGRVVHFGDNKIVFSCFVDEEIVALIAMQLATTPEPTTSTTTTTTAVLETTISATEGNTSFTTSEPVLVPPVIPGPNEKVNGSKGVAGGDNISLSHGSSGNAI